MEEQQAPAIREAEPAAPVAPVVSNFRFVGNVAPLFEALAKAQAEFVPMVRDSEVAFSGRIFTYATLAEVLDSVRPALNKYGIALLQPFDGDTVLTLLCLGAARFEVSAYLGDWKGVQDLGSRLTYIKRYQLKSVLGVNDGDDDDGNVADGTGKVPQPRAKTQAQPPKTDAKPKADGVPEDLKKRITDASKAIGHKSLGDLADFSDRGGFGLLKEQTLAQAEGLLAALLQVKEGNS